MEFAYLKLYRDYVEKVQGRRIILFGAGNNALHALHTWFQHGEVYEIWDNNPEKEGTSVGGYTVNQPRRISSIDVSTIVILITVAEELSIVSIMAQLRNLGFENIYPLAILSLSNVIERYNADFSKKFHELNSYRIIEDNKNKIQEVRALLADDKSRYVYDAIVEKTKYNEDSYLDICDDIYEHYFSDGFFSYGDEEVFVDGGAFLGEDTIRLSEFIGKDRIKKAYCFEPDAANYIKCARNLKKYFQCDDVTISEDRVKSDRYTVLRAGMWNENSNVGFVSYGTHASVFAQLRNAIAEESIQAVRIDDVVEDKVTLIKMDIEGAEIPALEGAKKTILKDKPKLAICIYHNIEDLWKIPLLIHSLVPEYKLYVRHHTIKFWDSVLYAQI